MNYDNRKFCIVATSAQNLAHIAPGRSHGVTVIKHRLVLAQDPMAAWEADWYKDEGGRDKSIPLHIQLLDAKGRLVRDRSLPLKVTLHYEKTYLSVTNQEVRSCRCWCRGARVCVSGARSDISTQTVVIVVATATTTTTTVANTPAHHHPCPLLSVPEA